MSAMSNAEVSELENPALPFPVGHTHEKLENVNWTSLYEAASLDISEYGTGGAAKPDTKIKTHFTPTSEFKPNADDGRTIHGTERHKASIKEKRRQRRLNNSEQRKARELHLNKKNHANAEHTSLENHDQADLPHSKQAYIGCRASSYRLDETIESLVNQGFRLIKYDGKSHSFGDVHNRTNVTFVPCSKDMSDVNEPLVEDMKIAQSLIDFTASNATQPKVDGSDEPRRGDFPTISVGISHGQGQKCPKNLEHTKQNQEALDFLLESPFVKRVAVMQSRLYKSWMPQLHKASEELLENLETWKPTNSMKKYWKPIHRNFQGSAFAATTFNFGPKVVCHAHRDHLNWVIGGCAITAGGNFDYTKGGHIVLIELKLILEFPPGATIIIPSAMVTHANLPIALHEHRISVTQYSAGGLFRFVDYGYCTAKVFSKRDPKAKQKKDQECEQRWKELLGMYEKNDKKAVV